MTTKLAALLVVAALGCGSDNKQLPAETTMPAKSR